MYWSLCHHSHHPAMIFTSPRNKTIFWVWNAPTLTLKWGEMVINWLVSIPSNSADIRGSTLERSLLRTKGTSTQANHLPFLDVWITFVIICDYYCDHLVTMMFNNCIFGTHTEHVLSKFILNTGTICALTGVNGTDLSYGKKCDPVGEKFLTKTSGVINLCNNYL